MQVYWLSHRLALYGLIETDYLKKKKFVHMKKVSHIHLEWHEYE